MSYCRAIFSCQQMIKTNHCYREVNVVADRLAAFAHQMMEEDEVFVVSSARSFVYFEKKMIWHMGCLETWLLLLLWNGNAQGLKPDRGRSGLAFVFMHICDMQIWSYVWTSLLSNALTRKKREKGILMSQILFISISFSLVPNQADSE